MKTILSEKEIELLKALEKYDIISVDVFHEIAKSKKYFDASELLKKFYYIGLIGELTSAGDYIYPMAYKVLKSNVEQFKRNHGI